MGKTNSGVCEYCGKEFSKMAIAKHLKTCSGRPQDTGSERYFLISVQDAYSPEYWMYLEAHENATLKNLDHFLRGVWLECCGHMSLFMIDQKSYSSFPDAEFRDKSMNVKLKSLLGRGTVFQYEYDMGSTTELKLKVVGELFGSEPGRSPVRLAALNKEPEIRCSQCGEAEAVYVCSECIYEGDGWLCEDCSEDHECGEEALLPVVNSPRVCICAYVG